MKTQIIKGDYTIIKFKPTFKKLKVMYKALLLNTKGEIEDYRFCETYAAAVQQCSEWQLEHEYDFWETKIIEPDKELSDESDNNVWQEETFNDEDLPF